MLTPWPQLARDVDLELTKDMFVHQNYDNPSAVRAFKPLHDEFFGTKNLGMLIVDKPYGWVDKGNNEYEFSWPDPGLVDDLLKIVSTINQFASYKLMIWVDLYTAEQVRALNPLSEFPRMMLKTGEKVQEFCVSIPQFEFVGYITSAPQVQTFVQAARQFLGNPGYRV